MDREKALETAKNVVWVVFGGVEVALLYAIVAIEMVILIVTIPLAPIALRLSRFIVWPVGRAVVRTEAPTKPLIVVANAVWLIAAGWALAVAHLVAAVALALTIIGIGRAMIHIRMIPVALWPAGSETMPAEEAESAPGTTQAKV